MTTNLTLDEMREIVSKAPEKTQVVIPCEDGCMFFAQRADGKWFRFSDSYEKWLEYYGKVDPMDLAIKLSSIKENIQAIEESANQQYIPYTQADLDQHAVWGEAFEKWWQSEGQYHRAGGDNYCKTFAWHAWLNREENNQQEKIGLKKIIDDALKLLSDWNDQTYRDDLEQLLGELEDTLKGQL